MKISSESELMKNHKPALIMPPGSQFQALQTNEGHSLFFSIGTGGGSDGTGGILQLSKEKPGDVLGWDHHELTRSLSAGSNLSAKTFKVAQNNTTGNIDLALAVTKDGKDELYLSLNNSNTDTSWTSQVNWQLMKYDDPDHSFPTMAIADIFIPQAHRGQCFVVDIIKDSSNSQNIVFRYFIDPTRTAGGKKNVWNPRDLPANLQSGSIQSVMGRRTQDEVDGIYTLGSVAGSEELIFTPLYDPYGGGAPNAVVFNLPSATAIAVAPGSGNSTNLFAVAGKALYFFPADKQNQGSEGQKIMDNEIFAGVKKLYADTVDSTVFVWGLNQAGEIFYLKCPAGQELRGTAWTYPIPLFYEVHQISPYINAASKHNVIFAHLNNGQNNGQDLVQLSQDPASACWQQRRVLLPATDVNHVIDYQSFSTHIHVTDDNNLPAGKPVTLSITSDSPVGIFVNNVYHKLSASVPVDILTDVTGAVTIIQETQTVTAICYHLTNGETGVKLDINPMGKLVDKLSKVKSGDDLDMTVTDEKGESKELLPAGTTADQKNATASSIKQFVATAAQLPPDGSKQKKPLQPTAFSVQPHTIWGVFYSEGAWAYHEGRAALTHFGLTYNASTNELEVVSADNPMKVVKPKIESVPEDFWHWLKRIFEKVEQFFVQLVDGISHFFVYIGEKIYHFIVDCISAIVHAVEFVFNKIKVFFEDLVKWLGFIFNWNDILRTHLVIKNVLLTYGTHCINSIDTFKADITGHLDNIKKGINKWAGLPTTDDKVTGYTAATSASHGRNSPQSRWGVYHAQNNATNATSKYPGQALKGSWGALEHANADAKVKILQAKDSIEEVFRQVSTLSISELLKKLVAIVVDLAIDTLEVLIDALLDMVALALEGVIDILKAPLDIPVISWLYKKVAKAELSILDLTCLVVAIPTTIIYKLAKEEAPFPDDSITNQLINAPDFTTIQRLCAAPAYGVTIAPLITLNDKLVFAGNCMAFGGSLLVSGFSLLKVVPDFPLQGPVAVLAAVSYLPYVAPGIIGSIQPLQEKKWYAAMNTTVTGIATLKTFLDAMAYKVDKADPNYGIWKEVSPFAEAAINFIWQIPTSGALFYPENTNKNGYMACIGGSLFDLGGGMAPVIEFTQGDVRLFWVGATVVCNVAYGSLALAQSLD